MNRFSAVILAALPALLAMPSSYAQERGAQSPEERAESAVEQRKAVFQVQLFSMRPVRGMLRGSPFDAGVAQKTAQRLHMTAGLIPEVFALDTRAFKVQTKARENIWTEKAEFDARVKELLDAATSLETAAKAGNKDAALKAVGAVGKSCDDCHDKFRSK